MQLREFLALITQGPVIPRPPNEQWYDMIVNGTVMGFYPDDTNDLMDQTARFCEGEISRKIRASLTGDRELHRMTGRYE